MVPDDPSTWLYRCHVNEHIDNGMECCLRSDLQIVLALLAKSQTLIDNNNSTG